MKFKTSQKISCVSAFSLYFNVENKNLYRPKKTAPTDPTQTALVWFGSNFIFKVNQTKPNRMLFYLAVHMTFNLKTEPNREHPYLPVRIGHTLDTSTSSILKYPGFTG